MELEYVDSSSIEAIGFDETYQQLHVRFLESGRTYIYSGVSSTTFDEFRESESKGKYFNAYIRDNYDFSEA